MEMKLKNDLSIKTKKIRKKAESLGFNLTGITPSHYSDGVSAFESWLSQGYHGEMGYLEKGLEKRKNPNLILEGVKSIICCAITYYTWQKDPSSHQNDGLISNYAWGKDYHKIILPKLEALEQFIHEEIDPKARMKSYVDTGPILERSYAQKAGLGWIGKNTCLINPELGSWFFLGEILTDLELAYDEPFKTDHCGTCTRCLDACPTEALTAPRKLDARLCISYLTIEHRGPISPEKREWIQNHILGCDICQEVCPYNHQPVPTATQDFYPKDFLNQNKTGSIALEKLSQITPEDFQNLFLESPIKRLKYEGLLRNTILAMGNSKNKEFISALKTLKTRVLDPSLQEQMDWAIQKLGS